MKTTELEEEIAETEAYAKVASNAVPDWDYIRTKGNESCVIRGSNIFNGEALYSDLYVFFTIFYNVWEIRILTAM